MKSTPILLWLGVAVAGWLVHRNQKKPEQEVIPPTVVPDPLPNPMDGLRLQKALEIGRRELEQPEVGSGPDIVVPDSNLHLRVGYREDAPFVAVTGELFRKTEMIFAIRRRRSALGLPRLVDNTPLKSAGFEYRLRVIDLPGRLGDTFEAATNRPRLFYELLAQGTLEEQIAAVTHHTQYRLEDLVYGGQHLTVLFQPAADPADTSYANDCIDMAFPFFTTLQAFISTTKIPSAQG
jgi:hypothetical protein